MLNYVLDLEEGTGLGDWATSSCCPILFYAALEGESFVPGLGPPEQFDRHSTRGRWQAV